MSPEQIARGAPGSDQSPRVEPAPASPDAVTHTRADIPGRREKSLASVATNAQSRELVEQGRARAAEVQSPEPAPVAQQPNLAGRATTVTRPFLYARMLFGPDASNLRDSVFRASPWIDQQSGPDVLWMVLGDPRSSGDQFRASVNAYGTSESALMRAYSEALKKRGTEAMVVANEEKLAADSFGVDIDELPCIVLVLNTPHDVSPEVVYLSSLLDQLPQGPQALRELISGAFGGDRLKKHFGPLAAMTVDQASAAMSQFVREVQVRARGTLAAIDGTRTTESLDPTDQAILELLRKSPDTRLTTPEISKGLRGRSVSKSLAKLVRLGYIDNVRRRGYMLLPRGARGG